MLKYASNVYYSTAILSDMMSECRNMIRVLNGMEKVKKSGELEERWRETRNGVYALLFKLSKESKEGIEEGIWIVREGVEGMKEKVEKEEKDKSEMVKEALVYGTLGSAVVGGGMLYQNWRENQHQEQTDKPE